MKGLPPTLRKKRRYIAFKIIPEKKTKITTRQIYNEIQQTIQSLYGEWYGCVGLKLEVFYEENSEGILRCSRDKVDATLAALTLITEVENTKVAIKTLGISGTIKGCKRFLNGKEINTER